MHNRELSFNLRLNYIYDLVKNLKKQINLSVKVLSIYSWKTLGRCMERL